jgi:hypothetical protein
VQGENQFLRARNGLVLKSQDKYSTAASLGLNWKQMSDPEIGEGSCELGKQTYRFGGRYLLWVNCISSKDFQVLTASTCDMSFLGHSIFTEVIKLKWYR